MPKEVKSSFSHFFREDAKLVADVLREEETQEAKEDNFPKRESLPYIKKSTPISDDEYKDEWRKIRSFFRQGSHDASLPDDFIPLVLSPSYTTQLTVRDFPIWLSSEPSQLDSCISLQSLLDQAMDRLNFSDDSILKRSRERLLNLASTYLEEHGSQPISEIIPLIFQELVAQLSVGGSEGEVFQKELGLVKNTLPDHGILIPFSGETNFQLLNSAIAYVSQKARKNLLEEVSELKSKLRDILRVEEAKGPAGHDPAKLHDSLSFADAMVKFEELVNLVPQEGSEQMNSERIDRIERLVDDLKDADLLLDFRASVFIDESLYNGQEMLWQKVFDKVEVNSWSDENGIGQLTQLFVEKISPFEKLFKSKRIAQLELVNSYQPDVHDDYFGNFTWQNFSDEELLQSTYFILIVDDVHLFDTNFAKLSNILSENVPVKILAVKRDYLDAVDSTEVEGTSSLHSQVELGALMMSYKNIYVAQSSSINPLNLYHQFKEGISAFAPAFFYVLDVEIKEKNSTFLQTSAAIESRDFPSFTFTGLLGTAWGSRFRIDHNPQPEKAWTDHQLQIINEEGEEDILLSAFTFADWCTLNQKYRKYFLPVPRGAWSENLIQLVDFLENDPESNMGKIPFIWMVDSGNQLVKVAVSWPVVIASQERLDFWHFLQENSGINNYHVALAVEQAKKELTEQYSREIEKLRTENKIEIERIKNDEAAKAMENLASILLDMDLENLNVAKSAKPIPIEKNDPVVDTPTSEPTPVEETVAKEEASLVVEAYIDTVLCTSCNECINKNKAMFRYNADKMAYIADANAGTFRQLVEAAEACPVGIIHPGTPLDHREPDLENLIQRAEKFN